MPKVIENLQGKILSIAREQFLSKGYRGLNVREIAKSCGVAVGTIYNYYASKEVIAAHVMLEDWSVALKEMEGTAYTAESMEDVIHHMYIEIRKFYQKYQLSWEGYKASGRSGYTFSDRHELLRSQLAGILRISFERLTNERNPYMPEFIADNLLTASCYEKMEFEPLAEILSRLFR